MSKVFAVHYLRLLRFLRSSLIYLFCFSLFFLILSFFSLLFIFKTEKGFKTFEYGLNYLSLKNKGPSLHMEGLSASLPLSFKLKYLELSDDDGVFSSFEDLKLSFNLRDLLLSRSLNFDFHLERLSLKRAYKERKAKEGELEELKSEVLKTDRKRSFSALPLILNADLNIGEINLGEGLFLKPLSFSASIKNSEEGLYSYAYLRGDDNLSLNFDLNFSYLDKQNLSLDLIFKDESAVLAALFNLPEKPFSLSLKGEGDIRKWQGFFLIDIDSKSSISSEIFASLSDNCLLSFKGSSSIDSDLLPEPLSFLIKETSFKLDFEKDRENIFLREAVFLSEFFDLRSKGLFSFKEERQDSFLKLKLLKENQDFSDWSGFKLSDDSTLELRLLGSFLAPDIFLNLKTASLKAGDLSLKDLSVDSLLTFSEVDFPDFNVNSRLKLSSLLVSDLSLPEDINADLILSYNDGDKLLSIDSLLIKNSRLLCDARGELELFKGDFKSELEFKLDDLSYFDNFLPFDSFKAESFLKAGISGNLYNLDLDFDLRGDLKNIQGLLPYLPDKELGFHSSFKIFSDFDSGFDNHNLQFEFLNLNLRGESFSVDAKGLFSSKETYLEADLKVFLNDLGLFEKDLKGSADLSLLLKGPLDKLLISSSLKSEELFFKNHRFSFLNFNFDGFFDEKLRAKAVFKADFSGFEFKAGSDLILDSKTLLLSDLSLDFPGFFCKGGADLDLRDMTFYTDLRGRLFESDLISSITGLNLNVGGDFSLVAYPAFKNQNLFLDLEFDLFAIEAFKAGSLKLDFNIKDVFGEPDFKLDLFLASLSFDEFAAESAGFKLYGLKDKFFLEGDVEGEAFRDFKAFFKLGSEVKEGRMDFCLYDFKGLWDKKPFKLLESAYASLDKGVFSLDLLRLELDKTQLALKLGLDKEDIRAFLELEDFPLSLAGLPFEGYADLDLNLSGSLSRPLFDLRLKAEKLCPSAPEDRLLPLMKLDLKAFYKQGLLSFESDFYNMETEEKLLNGLADLPFLFSLKPFLFSFDKEAELRAEFKGLLDLQRFGLLLLPENHLIHGLADLDLNFEGSFKKPRPRGSLNLKKASYQELELGIAIYDIYAAFDIFPESLNLKELKAGDGNGGFLEGGGELFFSAEKAFPFSFFLKASDFKLLHNDIVLSVLSKADLLLEGSFKKQCISGKLLFDRNEIFLGDFGTGELVELPVKEVYGSEEEKESLNGLKKEESSLELKLELDSPSRIFVRGRGLDSEWGGKLFISSFTSNLLIRGDISLLRGRMEFLGKRLLLDHGHLMFDGRQPPAPFLTMEARQEGRDIVCILRLEGQPSALNFILSSEPALPQDEVLSHMLFGRSASNISPIQAAQLALAARSLAKGGGPGAIDKARSFLKLDDLNIVSDGDDNDDMRLRAGKYIHDKVYLRLEKDLKSDDDLVTADVELSPRFSLESKLGPKGGGMGLFWKNDY